MEKHLEIELRDGFLAEALPSAYEVYQACIQDNEDASELSQRLACWRQYGLSERVMLERVVNDLDEVLGYIEPYKDTSPLMKTRVASLHWQKTAWLRYLEPPTASQ